MIKQYQNLMTCTYSFIIFSISISANILYPEFNIFEINIIYLHCITNLTKQTWIVTLQDSTKLR